jgi:uncharacterized protein GlcG (DUF336 family)
MSGERPRDESATVMAAIVDAEGKAEVLCRIEPSLLRPISRRRARTRPKIRPEVPRA